MDPALNTFSGYFDGLQGILICGFSAIPRRLANVSNTSPVAQVW